MSVRWTKNLASFSALASSDQVTRAPYFLTQVIVRYLTCVSQAVLLEEGWSELFLLCSIQAWVTM